MIEINYYLGFLNASFLEKSSIFVKLHVKHEVKIASKVI